MGSEGGKARNANLTPERRKEIAREAGKARWARVKASKRRLQPIHLHRNQSRNQHR